MKIEEKNATVTTNLKEGKSVDMGIDEEGLVHIMSLLTNLYKDPELAIIREYYANALDSHVEAGQDRPVEVTLPTWDAPVFAVQDYGVGMSSQEIMKIYAQYGGSTKRKSNELIGAYGLGCKSALTIATQFTLVSIKDGFKTTVLVSKTESGVNKVRIVNETLTDDPNGVLVTIPIPNTNIGSFTNKANNFFKFSEPGIVLVNGREPLSVYDNAKKIDTDDGSEIYLGTSRFYYETSYLIMGNVPYELSPEDVTASLSRVGANFTDELSRSPKYFKIEIGDVHLTPSREGLRFTDKTNAVVDKFISKLFEGIKKTAQADVDALANRSELYEVLSKWSYVLGHESLNWKGEDIVKSVTTDNPVIMLRKNRYSSTNSTYDGVTNITLSQKHIIVTIDDLEKYKKTSYYFNSFMLARGLDYGEILLTDHPEDFDNVWFTENSNFTFLSRDEFVEEAKEFRKKERANNKITGVKTKTKYRVLDIAEGTAEDVSYDEIPDNTPYVRRNDFYSGNPAHQGISKLCGYADSTFSGSATFVSAVRVVTDEKKLILLSHGLTEDALTKRVKGAYNIKDTIEKKSNEFESLITDEIKDYLTHKQEYGLRQMIEIFQNYDVETEILDKDLKDALNPDSELKEKVNKLETLGKALDILRTYSSEYRSHRLSNYVDDTSRVVTDRYPLIGSINTYSMGRDTLNHFIIYANEIYRLNNEQTSDTMETMKGNNND